MCGTIIANAHQRTKTSCRNPQNDLATVRGQAVWKTLSSADECWAQALQIGADLRDERDDLYDRLGSNHRTLGPPFLEPMIAGLSYCRYPVFALVPFRFVKLRASNKQLHAAAAAASQREAHAL